jgi:CheY-like chemotaxis protein
MKREIYKVYILDDDIDDLDLLSSAFESVDCASSISCFTTSLNLLDNIKLLTSNELPDIIIIDHQLPILNGGDIVTQIRNDKKYKDITIAIYSTLVQSAKIESMLSNGVDFYLSKGNSYEELKKHVGMFCQAIMKKQLQN